MAESHIDVRYVANLARINLTEDEVTCFESQLEDIMGYIDEGRARLNGLRHMVDGLDDRVERFEGRVQATEGVPKDHPYRPWELLLDPRDLVKGPLLAL